MIEICRDHAANVKRWQDGQMVLRWIAAGMGEAGQASSAASTATCTCPPCASRSTNHRRCHTDQGGCRLIKYWTAAEVPRERDNLRMESVPMLNLPVHGPPRPTRSPLLRAAPVRREPLGPHRHHLSHRGAAGRRLLRGRGTSLEAATRADLEAFVGRPAGHGVTASTAATYHKVLKILYGWLAEEKEIPTNPMAK